MNDADFASKMLNSAAIKVSMNDQPAKVEED
jgi:hypothetical protein